MDNSSSIVLYFFVLLLCVFLPYFGKKKGVLLSFFILIFFSGFRYDIGNDYEVQFYNWNNLSLFSNRIGFNDIVFFIVEPMQLLFCYLFRWADNPAIYVFFCYSLVFHLFLFKAIKDNLSNFSSGIFIFFTSLFIFYTWDWTRQGVSFAIFLFAIKYIKNRNVFKYWGVILFASLFHISALFMLPVYFINRIAIGKKVAIIVILIFTILAYLGVFQVVSTYVINKIGFLYGNYAGSEHSLQNKNVSIGVFLLFKSIISTIIVYYLPSKEFVMKNVITLGTLMILMSSLNLLVERMSCYFLFVQILGVGYVFKRKFPIDKLISMSLVFLLFFAFIYALSHGGTRGGVPYDNILLDNYNKNFFRYRKFLQ